MGIAPQFPPRNKPMEGVAPSSSAYGAEVLAAGRHRPFGSVRHGSAAHFLPRDKRAVGAAPTNDGFADRRVHWFATRAGVLSESIARPGSGLPRGRPRGRAAESRGSTPVRRLRVGPSLTIRSCAAATRRRKSGEGGCCPHNALAGGTVSNRVRPPAIRVFSVAAGARFELAAPEGAPAFRTGTRSLPGRPCPRGRWGS